MPHEFQILLVEDSPTDALIIGRALREAGLDLRLTVCDDGQRALDGLLAPSAPESARPDLILLDLNLPGLDGHQILARIKGDSRVRAIPVVVLTTSDRADDIVRAYDAGANTYIQKPSEYPHYRDLVLTLRNYWQSTALLPRRGNGSG